MIRASFNILDKILNLKLSKMTSKVEIRVDGKYKIGQLIAVGGNSEVYEGMNMHTLEPVALKLEYDRANPSLYRESEILKMLEGCIGIPLLYYVGKEGDFKIMVTELLGDDLRVILAKFDKPLGLKSCLMIAD